MNNCLTCCNMTFPNNCSFLKLSDGRLRLHLSKLLCRPFCIKFSSGELYVVVCDARGKDSDRGGNTSLCVCVHFSVTWSTGSVFCHGSTCMISAPSTSSSPVQTALMALACRNSWAAGTPGHSNCSEVTL